MVDGRRRVVLPPPELARVPEPGEQFTWRNLRLTITDADRRKVNRVRVEILEPQPAAPAGH